MSTLRPLLLLALLLLPGLAAAQGSRHYDAQGRYIGRSETSGATTRHYDAQGRYQGRSEGGRRYDAAGRYLGRTESR